LRSSFQETGDILESIWQFKCKWSHYGSGDN